MSKRIILILISIPIIFILLIVIASTIVRSNSGFNVSVTSGAGGMPMLGKPYDTHGHLLEGEEFTFVVTEKFPSLAKYTDAKVIKRVSSTSGRVKVKLPPGKYGAYIIYNGTTILYGDLKIENYRNDVPLDNQGAWYIQLFGGYKDIEFGVNSQPS